MKAKLVTLWLPEPLKVWLLADHLDFKHIWSFAQLPAVWLVQQFHLCKLHSARFNKTDIFDVVVNVNLTADIVCINRTASIYISFFVFPFTLFHHCKTAQYTSAFAVNTSKDGSLDEKNDPLRIRRVFLDYNFGCIHTMIFSKLENLEVQYIEMV